MRVAADIAAKCFAMADRVDGSPVAPAEAFVLDVASEKAFQREVVGLAESEGWRVFHPFDMRRSEPGYPDLTMVRDRVIIAELKHGANGPTAEQSDWLDSFRAAGVAAYLWYPADWPEIVRVLTAEREWKKREGA